MGLFLRGYGILNIVCNKMILANKEESNDTKLNSDPIDFCMMKQDSLAMIKHNLAHP